MIGAFFMATDYVTSPITPTGKIIYGLVIGILAAVFRLYGNTPEGMSFAIIITNLLVPLIEKVTVPKSRAITDVSPIVPLVFPINILRRLTFCPFCIIASGVALVLASMLTKLFIFPANEINKKHRAAKAGFIKF